MWELLGCVKIFRIGPVVRQLTARLRQYVSELEAKKFNC